MGATVAFTDLESLAGTNIAELGVLEVRRCPQIGAPIQFPTRNKGMVAALLTAGNAK